MSTCGKNKKRARAAASESMRLWTVTFKPARESLLVSKTTLPGRLCAARRRTSSRRLSFLPSGNRGGRPSAPLSARDLSSCCCGCLACHVSGVTDVGPAGTAPKLDRRRRVRQARRGRPGEGSGWKATVSPPLRSGLRRWAGVGGI